METDTNLVFQIWDGIECGLDPSAVSLFPPLHDVSSDRGSSVLVRLRPRQMDRVFRSVESVWNARWSRGTLNSKRIHYWTDRKSVV